MTLPSALAPMMAHARWLGWRWVRLPDGRMDKPPCRGDHPDFHASTTKPNSWCSFATAAASLAAGKMDGVGYVCAEDGDRIYVDLDDCIDPISREIADWAMRLVEECGSYTEITPSGHGLRIIGTHDGSLKYPIHSAYKLPSGGHGEVFFRAVRYITVTGRQLEDTSDTLADISGPVLDLLAAAGKAASKAREDFGATRTPEEASAPLIDVRSSLAIIPNGDLPYDDWVRIGLACFASTGGTGEGFEVWQAWSAKSAKHQDDQCLRVWRSFQSSPPTKIGFGTLVYLARAHNPLWAAPSWLGEAVAKEANDPFGQAQPRMDLDIYPTLSLEEVMALPPPTWLVQNLLTEGGFATLYAPPASYKSFVALALGLSVAYGQEWMGRKVKAAGVLYIAGEGARGLGKRIKAWQRKHTLDGCDAPFRLLSMSVNLTDPLQTAKVIRTAMAASAAEGMPIGLVIIDTVARSMSGADENSAQAMGLFVEACGDICREVQAAVLGIHHTGKDTERGARGSNALLGGVDAEIKLERHGERLTMTVTKQKDDEEGDPISLKAEKVDISEPLRPAQSLVIVQDDALPGRGGPETAAEREERMGTLAQIAQALGPNGIMTTSRLVEAIGWPSGGRARARIAILIPFAPDCIDIIAPEGPAKLWRVRQGEGDTSPINVRRHDVE